MTDSNNNDKKKCVGKFGCGQIKPIDDFPFRKDSPDGRRNQCKECRDKYLKYWSENKEQIKLAKEKYKNPPEGFAYCHGEYGCKELKPISEFDISKHAPSGLCSMCKTCSKEYDKKLYRKNIVQNKQKAKIIRDRDREKNKAKYKVYCLEHGDELRAARKAKRIANKEYYKKRYRESGHSKYLENRDAILKAKKERYKIHKKEIMAREQIRIRNNPEALLRSMIRCHFKRALKYFMMSKNENSGSKLLGCTYKDFKQHIENLFYQTTDGRIMTWMNYGKEWHLDHIKPLSSFNLHDEEQIKQACHYTNIQPLWAKHNLSKWSKVMTPEELEELKKTPI